VWDLAYKRFSAHQQKVYGDIAILALTTEDPNTPPSRMYHDLKLDPYPPVPALDSSPNGRALENAVEEYKDRYKKALKDQEGLLACHLEDWFVEAGAPPYFDVFGWGWWNRLTHKIREWGMYSDLKPSNVARKFNVGAYLSNRDEHPKVNQLDGESFCNPRFYADSIRETIICVRSIPPNQDYLFNIKPLAEDRSGDVCSGDSGGPLFRRHDGNNMMPAGFQSTTLVGLVSYGSPSCLGNRPAAFTHVGSYRSWITKHTVPHPRAVMATLNTNDGFKDVNWQLAVPAQGSGAAVGYIPPCGV